MAAARHTVVHGYVGNGFEPVRNAFLENFSRRRELGAACCIYRRGEKVVDLWGGIRNKATGEPWQEDTMVLVHSATKVLSAMTLAVAHSRGWLDYEERVCKYWPEFAQQGKDQITVRQLLAHQAGLPSAPLPDAQSGFTPRAEPETAVCIHVEVGHSHVSKLRDRVKVKRMIRRRHSKRF